MRHQLFYRSLPCCIAYWYLYPLVYKINHVIVKCILKCVHFKTLRLQPLLRYILKCIRMFSSNSSFGFFLIPPPVHLLDVIRFRVVDRFPMRRLADAECRTKTRTLNHHSFVRDVYRERAVRDRFSGILYTGTSRRTARATCTRRACT